MTSYREIRNTPPAAIKAWNELMDGLMFEPTCVVAPVREHNMADKNLTPEEFANYLLEFFAWTSTSPRPIVNWLSSLETWATWRYNDAAKKKPEPKELTRTQNQPGR